MAQSDDSDFMFLDFSERKLDLVITTVNVTSSISNKGTTCTIICSACRRLYKLPNGLKPASGPQGEFNSTFLLGHLLTKQICPSLDGSTTLTRTRVLARSA